MVSWHGPFFDVRLLARCYANISSCNVEMFFNSGYKYYIPRLELLIGPRLTPPPNMWPVRRLQTLLLASMKAGRWLRFSGLGPRLWKRPDGRQKDLKWTPVFFFMYHSFVCFCCFVLTDWCGSTTDQSAWWDFYVHRSGFVLSLVPVSAVLWCRCECSSILQGFSSKTGKQSVAMLLVHLMMFVCLFVFLPWSRVFPALGFVQF